MTSLCSKSFIAPEAFLLILWSGGISYVRPFCGGMAASSSVPWSTPLAKMLERALGCPIAAHAVNRAPGGCGRRAQVNPFHRSRIPPPGRAQEELQAGDRAAVDVSSHQVCIPLVHCLGAKDSPGQDALTKAGRKTFYLRLDCLQR